MSNLITSFIEKRNEELLEDAITRCYKRLIEAGLHAEDIETMLDVALEVAMQDEDWSTEEAIFFYNSIEVGNDELDIEVELEGFSNDN